MKEAVIRMAGADRAEVLVYDVIGRDFFGDGLDAKRFREQVMGVKAQELNLRVNSPGGSVTEGAAMMATLDQWARQGKGRSITADVDGLAASAASILMMAAGTVRVASNALVMVHNPYTMAVGDAAEMRRTAELLDKVREQAIDAYARHSQAGREQIGAWMDAETWFTAREAVDAGLAEEVTGEVPLAAFAGHAEALKAMKLRKAPPLPAGASLRAAEETARRREIAARLCGG